LTKAELLASLHRVDYEAHGLKQKVVVDSIGVCLANKDDFRSEAVRDALADLIKDEVPAQALMRTAILAVQVGLGFWDFIQCTVDNVSTTASIYDCA
jgi:ornithine cyclodeaminase/alanine dehydrogenase-like protein (mu-crystallin family)